MVGQYASLGLPLIHAGKVRELYALPETERLLMVATDNVSAFDHVLPSRIPDKGIVLTRLSLWWFEQLADLVPNHVLGDEVPRSVAGRALVVARLRMVGVEAVARGYLTGSGWAEYRASGTVAGIRLPSGLHDGARLPEPIFTPARKAGPGDHDENITFAQLVNLVGAELAGQLRSLTLAIYSRAELIAGQRGIVLADTKLEFGHRSDGRLVLGDEALTPDSSRFWDAEAWASGRLVSFDKQYLRDWLVGESGWDRRSNPPPLPARIVAATRERYLEAYRRLTRHRLALPAAAGQGPDD